MTLVWSAPAASNGVISGYRLFYDTLESDAYNEVELPADTSEFKAMHLDPGVTFRYHTCIHTYVHTCLLAYTHARMHAMYLDAITADDVITLLFFVLPAIMVKHLITTTTTTTAMTTATATATTTATARLARMVMGKRRRRPSKEWVLKATATATVTATATTTATARVAKMVKGLKAVAAKEAMMGGLLQNPHHQCWGRWRRRAAEL